MADRYLEFMQSPWGRRFAGIAGLPVPPRLQRATGPYPAQPLAGRRVLLAGAPQGRLATPLLSALQALGAEIYVAPAHDGFAPVKQAATGAGIALRMEPEDSSHALDAIVFDASGVEGAVGLRTLHELFHPRLGRLGRDGRVLVLGLDLGAQDSLEAQVAFGALSGFVRSLGKEIGRRGCTANLIEVAGEGASALSGVLTFLLSPNAAFISGQVLRVDTASPPQSPQASLTGRRALVTGAARGIGAAIAATLAREGATVVGVDRPQEQAALEATLAPLGGQALALDVTAADAGRQIAAACPQGLDVVVHNAGITRDRLLRKMTPAEWDQVLGINLGSMLRITAQLIEQGLNPAARIVCLASIGGIAGNPGQTNYAASKAGVIRLAAALAPMLARSGGAINAVAPGFIETRMTAQMPWVPREFGRRLSSLQQSGQPEDVAEAVTFLASPLAAGINGRSLRVCGQHLMGA
jgi:3-oxoacyl-[acyl-carrier protein] reductase